MIYWRIYGFFLNPLKQVTKCCKMFTILADIFPSVLDDHERGTLYEELRMYDVWDPPAHIEAAFEHDNDSRVKLLHDPKQIARKRFMACLCSLRSID